MRRYSFHANPQQASRLALAFALLRKRGRTVKRRLSSRVNHEADVSTRGANESAFRLGTTDYLLVDFTMEKPIAAALVRALKDAGVRFRWKGNLSWAVEVLADGQEG